MFGLLIEFVVEFLPADGGLLVFEGWGEFEVEKDVLLPKHLQLKHSFLLLIAKPLGQFLQFP